MKQLWVEEFRPKTVDEYVFQNDTQKQQINKWISERYIPQLALVGDPGTGKTSLAYLLKRELGVDDGDFMMLNASLENNVATVRQKILNFCRTMSFGDFKIIVLDEFDRMTPDAQGMLRNLTETYSDICRFILTANYPNKIIPALHSRFQFFHFYSLEKNDFTIKVAEILAENEIEFDVDTVDSFVQATYPDLRKCINLVQQNSTSGELLSPSSNEKGTSDYMLRMIDLFKKGHISEGRKVVTQEARAEEYPNIYRFFYNNLDLWGDTEDKQNEAILIIAKRLKDHTLVADPEINLSACLIELGNI